MLVLTRGVVPAIVLSVGALVEEGVAEVDVVEEGAVEEVGRPSGSGRHQ